MDKLFLCNITFDAKPNFLLQGAIARARGVKWVLLARHEHEHGHGHDTVWADMEHGNGGAQPWAEASCDPTEFFFFIFSTQKLYFHPNKEKIYYFDPTEK